VVRPTQPILFEAVHFFHSPKAIEIFGFHPESQEKNLKNPVNSVQI